MTIQSSFLIRCWLHSGGGSMEVKTYHVQHVQSGAELRSSELAAVLLWMTSENLRHLDRVREAAAAGGAGEGK